MGRGWQRVYQMSRRCELTAKGPQVGHKVSHSNIKTKRRFLPNLCNVTFISDALGRNVRLRVAHAAVDDAEQRDDGGLVGGDRVEIAHGSLTAPTVSAEPTRSRF